MSEQSDDKVTQKETENAWHALPGMIGDIIPEESGAVVCCGGYIVEKDDDNDVVIYEVDEVAGSEHELTKNLDATFRIGDGVYNVVQISLIPEPMDGWESEIEMLPDEIWGGYE